MKLFIATVAILVSSYSIAGVDTSSGQVQGKIVRIDSKNVVLWVEGKEVTVPRSAVPSYFTIRPGNEVVAYFQVEQPKRKR